MSELAGIELWRSLGALLLVVGLITFLGVAARKLEQLRRRKAGHRGDSRLQVIETRWIDQRHRLLLVRVDANEHAILLGPGAPLIVQAGDAGGTQARPALS